jgi:hypothetical protein
VVTEVRGRLQGGRLVGHWQDFGELGRDIGGSKKMITTGPGVRR